MKVCLYACEFNHVCLSTHTTKIPYIGPRSYFPILRSNNVFVLLKVDQNLDINSRIVYVVFGNICMHTSKLFHGIRVLFSAMVGSPQSLVLLKVDPNLDQ